MCDCEIGCFNDNIYDILNLSNYIEKCIDSSIYANKLNKMFSIERKIQPLQYIDFRSNMTKLNFCCNKCGKEINYKELRKKLKEKL